LNFKEKILDFWAGPEYSFVNTGFEIYNRGRFIHMGLE
jgi:hypothetical protein